MRILFFAPHSALWVHAFPEALVAEALVQAGNEVTYIGCSGLLKDYCVAMIAQRVSFGSPPGVKERVCRECRGNRDLIRSRLGLRGKDLLESVQDSDLDFAKSVMSSLNPETCTAFVVDGIEIGKIALYELILQTKKSEITFTEEEWIRYQLNVRNCLIVLSIAKRLFLELRPERVIVYNPLYSVNRVICRLAEERGIAQYFLHAGLNLSNRLQTLILAQGHSYRYFQHLRDKWATLKSDPCTPSGMHSATKHFLEVVAGRSVWAYSSTPAHGSDARSTFGIDREKKIISATLSSPDEFMSAEITGVLKPGARRVFASQLEWIQALIPYVARRSDLFLIVRVHPREFPNKRERALSEHARKLQETLVDLPPNVRVNWPSDGLSLYDLANVTDVFLSAWSSAGKEMAWLGLPVVLYSPDLSDYPADLNYVGVTEQEYFQRIEQALAEGWSPERIRKTYRWCAIEYGDSLLDISESFSRKEVQSVFSRVKRRIVRKVFPFHEQKTDCDHRAPRLVTSGRIHQILEGRHDSVLDLANEQRPISYTEETALLRTEVKKLLRGLYGTSGGYPKSSLAEKLHAFCTG